MTVAALARLLCLASGVFGRPAWEEAKCAERAAMIGEAAARYDLDPVILVAVDVVECDLGDRDRRGRGGVDACPMGVHFAGVAERRRYDARALYEEGARRLARGRELCRVGRHHRHSFVAHYNWGSRAYAAQVLAVAGALRGRAPRGLRLAERTREIVRRLLRVFSSKEGRVAT